MGAGFELDAKGTASSLQSIASDAMGSVGRVGQAAARPRLTGLISKQSIMPQDPTGVKRWRLWCADVECGQNGENFAVLNLML